MYSLQKQICAGVLVSGILLTNLIPYGVMAEEDVTTSSESWTTIVPEVAPENTGIEVIDTSISASGTEISAPEETPSTPEISASGSENTGSIIASENIWGAPGEILPEETTNTSALLESSETNTGSLEIPEGVISEKIQGMTEIAQSKIKTTDQNHDTESNSGEVYKSQEVLVQFKENLNIDSIMWAYQVERMVQSAGHEVKEIIPGTNIAVVGNVDIFTNTFEKKDIASLFSTKNEDSTTEELITLYSKDPRVEQVQPNYKYELASIPNDPEFSNQWSLNNVGQTVNGITGTNNADINYPEAMDIFSGSSNSGTIVAVLDSGIEYDHPDFAGHLWDGTNCVSYTGANLGGCRYGYDFYMEDNDPYSNGVDHGSMVASIIGGVTNNGTGITGIAPNVKIMAVRVCSSVGCYTSDVIRGIQFAEKNGAKVINASFGGNRTMTGVSDYDWAYHDAIANFSGVFVTAAGNEASDNDIVYSFPGAFGQAITLSGEISSGGTIVYSGNVTIPALDNIINVAATDQNDGLASFSNYGSGSVDIGAPGTNILGAVGGGSVTSSGQISSASGWIRDGQSPAFWWEQNDQNGILVGTWADAWYPYASGATTNLTKTYNFPYTTTKTIGFNVWCDTPSSAQYTDYIQVEYSTGWAYTILRKIDEDILSLFWNTVALWTHTGAIDTTSFSLTASGNVTVRLKWITDTIDQVDEAGQAHYGCLVYSNTLEYTSDRGATGKYDYMDGTSFASPMVAGAVALGMTYNPNVTPSLMKQIVLETGDSLGSLSGTTRTGKRLNLENMLHAMQVPQISSLTHTLDTYNSATISYALTNAATGTIFFGKNPALFATDTGTIVYSGVGLSGSYMASNLESDTQYFYQVKTADGKYFSGTTSTTYSFTTPKVLEYTETGMVNTSGSIYLSGSTSTGVTYENNESGSLILTNTGNTFSLTIPLSGSTLTPVASGWNGLMGNMTQKQANTVITMADSTQISVRSIYGILGGSGYALSGNTSTLNISLPSDNGATISIYESLDGSTYALAGTCTVSGGNCTISSLASLGNWAIGYPVYPVISTPISGTTTGGGGGGSASSASSSSSSASSSSPFLYTNKTLLETLWDTKNGVMSTNTPIRGTINFLNRTSIMENIRQNSDITLDLINYLETDGLARGKKLILLDINIHVLQSKLNKDTMESTEKKNLIINLQKLNQRKIKLIRDEFRF